METHPTVLGGNSLRYCISSGLIGLEDREGGLAFFARGYSGAKSHLNDVWAESLKGLGPIPQGGWYIRSAMHHPRLGPCAIPLAPAGHDAHGRTEFFIHGDNRFGDFTASEGCIVASRATRETIRALGLRWLLVTE